MQPKSSQQSAVSSTRIKCVMKGCYFFLEVSNAHIHRHTPQWPQRMGRQPKEVHEQWGNGMWHFGKDISKGKWMDDRHVDSFMLYTKTPFSEDCQANYWPSLKWYDFISDGGFNFYLILAKHPAKVRFDLEGIIPIPSIHEQPKKHPKIDVTNNADPPSTSTCNICEEIVSWMMLNACYLLSWPVYLGVVWDMLDGEAGELGEKWRW